MVVRSTQQCAMVDFLDSCHGPCMDPDHWPHTKYCEHHASLCGVQRQLWVVKYLFSGIAL